MHTNTKQRLQGEAPGSIRRGESRVWCSASPPNTPFSGRTQRVVFDRPCENKLFRIATRLLAEDLFGGTPEELHPGTGVLPGNLQHASTEAFSSSHVRDAPAEPGRFMDKR